VTSSWEREDEEVNYVQSTMEDVRIEGIKWSWDKFEVDLSEFGKDVNAFWKDDS
jgi:hypothetical protein